ncbi:hypothetical protein BAG01nite_19470 [Brevibacillus agri]|uniref:ABC transporter permease n=1 Tax=Brevibacillus agri TaxID=51101 RepID=A0A3M8AUX9_9BACL|nr:MULTISPECIES: ABC transporter permease [Brevibacillus]ELK41248.1 hypothetical protein D478_15060 [Brevibacillus agri BAB-2500]EJL47478.1 ABC-type transport system, involved in lipoprotein release, permease component [Brevibacillus sp. CF112]MBG9566860.1 macrolide ABC transporter permease [Brevibacillus agri]MCG5254238.1 ABC transporter permease [Brevibacillus agri]MDN4095244.1 ABC transporter permease [Brevibacillus agri]
MTLSSIKNQFKAHPVTTALIILGLTISIVLISIGISSVRNTHLLIQQQVHYAPQNATKIELELSDKQDVRALFKVFDGISDQTGVILDRAKMFHNGLMAPVTPEYWTKQVVQRFPLETGRYLNVTDIIHGEKVALVGKARGKDVRTKNGKPYILLDNEEYEVIGIIGVKGKTTKAIDYKIVIPATSLSSTLLSKLQSAKTIPFLIHNSYTDTYADEKQIKQNAKRLFPEATCTASPYGETEGIVAPNRGSEIYISIMVYALAIINAINLTAFWIQERKYEIGIRKAFGYSNADIVSMLFWEMCVINLIAVVIGFSIQWMIRSLLSKWLDYPVEITSTTIFAAILFVFATAFVTTAIPSSKALKIQPVEAIRG